jgi:uncharacterized membrane protein
LFKPSILLCSNRHIPGSQELAYFAGMKPLVILLAVLGLSCLAFWIFTDITRYNLVFCGNLAMFAMLCFTALGHFLFPKGMAMMIPHFIPFRIAIVYITGLAEIVLGFLLLFPAYRFNAGACLLLFFLLILPANIYAAIHRIDLQKGTATGPGPSYLWFRIPLQLFFMAWVVFFVGYLPAMNQVICD